MTWVKLDDGFFYNRKVMALSNGAKLLFVAGVCHCNHQLTDGFIETGAARTLLGMLALRPKVCGELVEAGMWHKREGGYEVHDYLQYQRDATTARREKAEAKERMRRLRSGRSSGTRSPRTDGERSDELRSLPDPSPQSPDVVTIPDNSRGAPSDGPGMGTSPNGNPPADLQERLASRLAQACTGKRRGSVQRDAERVVSWALGHLDERLIDECIGRAAEQQPPPVMPVYVAAVIEQRAAESGIRVPPFQARDAAGQ